MTPRRPTWPWHEKLWRLVAMIAIVAQGVFATSSLTDIHGVGAAAHVEAAGINLHYTHNEATCVACTMAALSAVATPHTVVILRAPLPETVRVAPYASPAYTAPPRAANPRAPPASREL